MSTVKKPRTDHKILLHTLKHNPRDGEVYITWEGETFSGRIQEIEVRRGIHTTSTFVIKGIINDE